MLPRLLLALIVIFGLYYSYLWLKKLPPERRRKALWVGSLWAVIAVVLLAVITGKLHPLAMVFAAALGVAKIGFTTLIRALPLLRFIGKNYHFGSPRFSTSFLQIELNIKTGQITGKVIAGPHANAAIESLSLEELSELEHHYKDRDSRSYYLIRMIKQRAGGGRSQEQQEQANYSAVGDPSIDEALQILGIRSSNPTKKEIIAAHRQLIQKFHPDRGGNDYLASRINLAKDILLKKFG